MSGETELEHLIALMEPKLIEGEFVFCTEKDKVYGDRVELNPLASYQEAEGLSLLLDKRQADLAGLEYVSVFRGISLTVHSSLDAVGFTAAIASKLAANSIPANVIAAHFHDYVFVPVEKAEDTLRLLNELKI
tara:strand:+ start:462 stop:860 length:399 start_codon:yes stop_codon:yes gene_type:complete